MSNYLKLIQNISNEYVGKIPSTFADTSNKKYKDVLIAIEQSIIDFMLDDFHCFRRKKTTFSTVTDQQEYVHFYGMILEDGLLIKDDYGNKSPLRFIEDYKEFIKSETQTKGIPTKYTIFDNKIVFSPMPDKVYEVTVLYLTDYFVKTVYTIDQNTASGQKNIYLSSTTGITQGCEITIEPDTIREETRIVDTVTTDNYVTVTENLKYTHASGSVSLAKDSFQYETDEPNFPKKFHKIIEYLALTKLYYDDKDNLNKYMPLYMNMCRNIVRESVGTKENKPHFKVI